MPATASSPATERRRWDPFSNGPKTLIATVALTRSVRATFPMASAHKKSSRIERVQGGRRTRAIDPGAGGRSGKTGESFERRSRPHPCVGTPGKTASAGQQRERDVRASITDPPCSQRPRAPMQNRRDSVTPQGAGQATVSLRRWGENTSNRLSRSRRFFWEPARGCRFPVFLDSASFSGLRVRAAGHALRPWGPRRASGALRHRRSFLLPRGRPLRPPAAIASPRPRAVRILEPRRRPARGG
jgi:hypothetical protein